MMNLRAEFGELDVYLFDQLLRGRVPPTARVIDVGCGGGRNLHYLMRQGYDVHGLDPSRGAIEQVQRHASEHGIPDVAARFRTETVEATTFEAGAFDFAILNAVLHFARDPAHWNAMVDATWRLLAPGGTLFARLSTTIGIEPHLVALGDGRYRLPGGTEWFLVDLEGLLAKTAALDAELVDPIKTVNVQNLRTMTTWVLSKGCGSHPAHPP